MNRANLKNYAPLARLDFIQAMKDRAAFYGLTANKIEPVVEQGDVAVIAGREHPRAVAKKRKQLEARIQKHGFEQTMEAMAYTWFNRLVAVRFMELHGYLDHGYRVLSHPEGKATPEIVDRAEHVEFPGLKRETIIDLKMIGNKEGELYRLLLSAQCNALHTAMPFLFERIDDSTELLLPDNLLHSNSLIRKLVSEIDEEDWQQVEIIGWLYQFYISKKKDEVMGKVVDSEDIPAATQLFTPNWIVKYLVQNSLGRQWLATYPQSALRQQMEYHIEPAVQTPEVEEQLKALTPKSLNPEELTLLDPACGSGHILVEAYDLFKAIYQERGYRAMDIPALILQKNLFGLEIDNRAAQLAAFALTMKARADDRHIFNKEAKPNILAFEDSNGMDATDITFVLNMPINVEDLPPSEYLFEEIEEAETPLFTKTTLGEKGRVSEDDIASVLALFENAKTFGSLIQVPPRLAAKLPAVERRLDDVLKQGNLTHTSIRFLKPLLRLSHFLTRKYDAVAANPPYMGSKAFNPMLKQFIGRSFGQSKGDLYAAFIERSLTFLQPTGVVSMVTMRSWMFLPTFEALRSSLIASGTTSSLVFIGYNSFPELNSKIALAVAFCIRNSSLHKYVGTYVNLNHAPQTADKNQVFLSDRRAYFVDQEEFKRIPGLRYAFWASENMKVAFDRKEVIEGQAPVRQGFQTGDNDTFLRYWHEVNHERVIYDATSKEDVFSRRKKWVPYHKGGPSRKWYGNHEYVVAFDEANYNALLKSGNCLPSRHLYFKEAITWSSLTSSSFGARYSPGGFTFSAKGACAFPKQGWLEYVLALLNSTVASAALEILAATMDFNVGSIREIPLIQLEDRRLASIVKNTRELIALSRTDWDLSELSWDFRELPVLNPRFTGQMLRDVISMYHSECSGRIETARRLEGENNALLAAAYDLPEELSGNVPAARIVLRGSSQLSECANILSYAIGCMMGRFSLDKPGLIYASSGNDGFEPSQFKTFLADGDGIVPLLGKDWGFRDDAANRVVEFVGVAWQKEHLEENLKFIADSLGTTSGEQPRETIRRYLSNSFYRHHLSIYKTRPVYWLFSSGRERAFQCLVYLHRYNEATLARMRTEYVIPLQGQIAARIEQLDGDKAKATSTSHRSRLQNEQSDLKKQETELHIFEEKLKHAADQRITLDLDDGVKVNYAKFRDLVAEAELITGGNDEE